MKTKAHQFDALERLEISMISMGAIIDTSSWSENGRLQNKSVERVQAQSLSLEVRTNKSPPCWKLTSENRRKFHRRWSMKDLALWQRQLLISRVDGTVIRWNVEFI
jgi:hypothetical protein